MFCVGCKKEMRPLKTGAILHFGGGHAVAADILRCPECGVQVANPGSAHCMHLNEESILRAKARLAEWFLDWEKPNG